MVIFILKCIAQTDKPLDKYVTLQLSL